VVRTLGLLQRAGWRYSFGGRLEPSPRTATA
jgi:hypothetical protein